MKKLKTVNLLMIALLSAGILSCTTVNPVLPLTVDENIQSFAKNPVFNISDRGASLSLKINFPAFNTKENKNGTVAKTAADVQKYEVYLLKHSSSSYPLNGDPIADQLSGTPVFTVTNNGASTKTVTFSKLPSSGTDYYYVAVRAFETPMTAYPAGRDLIQVNNGRTNPGDEWTGTTAAAPFFGRIAVSNGVRVDENFVLSIPNTMTVSPKLLDSDNGATLEGNIEVNPGTVYFSGNTVPNYNILTIAGTGAPGYLPSGSFEGSLKALQTSNSAPRGVIADSAGNVYFSDASDFRVRKIDTSGNVTTIAGTGISGNTGDNGPATSALLNGPKGLALDSAGNLYIVDTSGSINRIRKVNQQGIITAFFGTGLSSPLGVAVDTLGNVYITDTANRRIIKINTTGTSSVFFSSATNQLNGITTDSSNNIYATGVDSSQNGSIFKISSAGTLTNTFTLGTIKTPNGISVDSTGNIYVAIGSLAGDSRIIKLNTSGTITNPTFAGTGSAGFSGDNGQASSATLNKPLDVFVDSSGNTFIADTTNNRIRKVNSSGIITSLAGITTAGFNGDTTEVAGTDRMLSSPEATAVDTSGNLYIADKTNHRIRKIDTLGNISTVAGLPLISNGTLPVGGFSGDNGPAITAQFNSPNGVAVNSLGEIFINDSLNTRIRKINTSGIVSTYAAGITGSGIAVDSAGNLYIADTGNNRLRKVNTSGIISTIAGTGTAGYSIAQDNNPASSAQLSAPKGVAVDSTGNIYIADTGNNRIRKISPSGTITTITGTSTAGYVPSQDRGPAINAQLKGPTSVAVDSAGNIYIADTGNKIIRKIDTNRIIYTIGGTGATCAGGTGGTICGDTGLAVNAQFGTTINGISVDSKGNIYFADTSIHRVRKLY